MLNKSNIEKVKEIVFKHPMTKFTIRELARKAGIAPPTALGIVRALQKEGFVREERVARASQISANFESMLYRRKKQVYNLDSVYSSGLVDYLIKAYHDPKAIILFGSYARGDDIERSDIDIAVLAGEEKRLDLVQFEKVLARKISIHEVQLDKVSEEFKNNLCNGTVLHGAL
jgi:predicted nucleotidyltransferase